MRAVVGIRKAHRRDGRKDGNNPAVLPLAALANATPGMDDSRLGLAVATMHPIMGAFFAAAVVRGHAPEPSQFLATAFGKGFTLQTNAAEVGINPTKVTVAKRKVATTADE